MRVVMLTTDRRVFEVGTATHGRMERYRALVERLDLVLVTRGSYVRSLFYQPPAGSPVTLVTAQDPFEVGLVGFLIARRLHARLELQIHTDIGSPFYWRESLKNKIRYALARFLLPRADCIRVVSERIGDFLKGNNYGLKALPVVLPIYVDLRAIQEAPITTDLHKKYSQFDQIVLMASRFTREKNMTVALEAMQHVVKRFPRAGLIIVGDGPEKNSLETIVQNRKLGDSVVIEKWSDNIASYYKTADLFLLTSTYEGYGMTLVEAAAAGCPLVTTDVGCVGDLLPRNSLWSIPVSDPAALVDALVDALGNPTERLRRAARATEAVRVLPERDEHELRYVRGWMVCGTSPEA